MASVAGCGLRLRLAARPRKGRMPSVAGSSCGCGLQAGRARAAPDSHRVVMGLVACCGLRLAPGTWHAHSYRSPLFTDVHFYVAWFPCKRWCEGCTYRVTLHRTQPPSHSPLRLPPHARRRAAPPPARERTDCQGRGAERGGGRQALVGVKRRAARRNPLACRTQVEHFFRF